MKLSEKYANRKPSITMEELEKEHNSPESKRYRLFLKICERLAENINCDEIDCGTYEEVLELIEKNNIYISDIIKDNEYQTFKNLLLKDDIKICPFSKKNVEQTFDFNKQEDMVKYRKLHNGGQF